MFMSERLADHQDASHFDDVEHGNLYRSAMTEYRGVTQFRTGRLYFTTLWQALAPSGNIYRYMGLEAEYWANAYNLQCQLEAIADDERIKNVLKGHESTESRVKVLVDALEEVEPQNAPDKDTFEKSFAKKGFPALQEFLWQPATRRMVVFYTPPWDGIRPWVHRRIIAFLVCSIQVVAPLVILLQEWMSPSNRLRNPHKFMESLQWDEVFCLGNSLGDRLHTVQGLILMELVILIAHTYIQDQLTNAHKQSLLPTCSFWHILGNLTNMWCCIVTAMAVPVLFWNEGSATTTSMDSLTMLFIFMLDDFAGYACQYMGRTDEDYQRAAAWQKAMLTQCPVDLTDVVNYEAKNPSQIWSFKYKEGDKDCYLLSTKLPNKGSRVALRCMTRVAKPTYSEETTPLQGQQGVLVYHNGVHGKQTRPNGTANILNGVWYVVDWFFTIFQIVVPIVWMIVDKPCYAGHAGYEEGGQ